MNRDPQMAGGSKHAHQVEVTKLGFSREGVSGRVESSPLRSLQPSLRSSFQQSG